MEILKKTDPKVLRRENLESEIDPEQKNLEIERKFLVKELPKNLEEFPQKEIKQGYIVILDDGTEVRVRKEQAGEEERYYQQTKSGGGEVRFESPEIELPKEVFDSFWKGKIGRGIEKTRYEIPYKYQDKQGVEKEV